MFYAYKLARRSGVLSTNAVICVTFQIILLSA